MSKNFFLRKDDLGPEMLGKLRKLDSVASERGQTLAEMALAWLLKDDLVTSVLVGASSVKQLEMNLKAINNKRFSQAEMDTIAQV
jgi:L-glyceraldehyde 3-phosphate reductase